MRMQPAKAMAAGKTAFVSAFSRSLFRHATSLSGRDWMNAGAGMLTRPNSRRIAAETQMDITAPAKEASVRSLRSSMHP